MTQYMILAEETAIKLCHAVRKAIAEGWRPQGGVSFDTNRKEFLQAMIKG